MLSALASLAPFGLVLQGNSGLFLSYRCSLDVALSLRHAFALSGILIRVVVMSDNQALLRFGLLAEQHQTRLQGCIEKIAKQANWLALLELSAGDMDA